MQKIITFMEIFVIYYFENLNYRHFLYEILHTTGTVLKTYLFIIKGKEVIYVQHFLCYFILSKVHAEFPEKRPK